MTKHLYLTAVLASLMSFNQGYSQETDNLDHTPAEKNNWGGKLIHSPFGLGLDIQTKYMWRGMEMMRKSRLRFFSHQ